MPDSRITSLSQLPDSQQYTKWAERAPMPPGRDDRVPDSQDAFIFIDVSDSQMSVLGTNKKITYKNMMNHMHGVEHIFPEDRTGEDSDVVTGTAGRNRRLTVWDSQGDLIEANGKVVLQPDGTLTIGSDSQSLAKFTVHGTDSDQLTVVIRSAPGQSVDVFQIQDSQGAELFTVTQDGYLGVIQPSPTEPIHVGNDSDAQTYIRVQNPTGDMYIGHDSATKFGYGSGNANLIKSTTIPLILGTEDSQVMILGTKDLERLRIDETGRIGIGTTDFTTSKVKILVDSQDQIGLLIHGDSDTGDLLHLVNDGGDADVRLTEYEESNTGPHISLQKAKGTETTPGRITASDEETGKITFEGYGAPDFKQVAMIVSRSQGALSGSGAPGYLQFRTTPSGALSPVPRLSIASNGKIIIDPTNTNPTPLAQLDIRNQDANDEALIVRAASGQVEDILQVQDSLGAELFTIDDEGNVGIDTAQPDSKFEVELADGEKIHFDGAGDMTVDVDRGTSSSLGRIRYQTAGVDEFETGLKGGVAGFHITDGDSQELLTILSSGNVGINDNTPESKLRIVNDISGQNGFLLKSADGQSSDIFRINDSLDAELFSIEADGDVRVKTNQTIGDYANSGLQGLHFHDDSQTAGYFTNEAGVRILSVGDDSQQGLKIHEDWGINWTAFQDSQVSGAYNASINRQAAAHLSINGSNKSNHAQLTVGGDTSLGTVTMYGHDDSQTVLVLRSKGYVDPTGGEASTSQNVDIVDIQDISGYSILKVDKDGHLRIISHPDTNGDFGTLEIHHEGSSSIFHNIDSYTSTDTTIDGFRWEQTKTTTRRDVIELVTNGTHNPILRTKDDASNASSRDFIIKSGDLTGSSHSSANGSGDVTLISGTISDSNAKGSGDVKIATGDSLSDVSTTGKSGNIDILTGAFTGQYSRTGNITLRTGATDGDISGDVVIDTGDANVESTNTGSVTINTGHSTIDGTSGGTAGNITLQPGSGDTAGGSLNLLTSDSVQSGNITLQVGASTDASLGGIIGIKTQTGGSIDISTSTDNGYTSAGGITLRTGDTTSTSGSGIGHITLGTGKDETEGSTGYRVRGRVVPEHDGQMDLGHGDENDDFGGSGVRWWRGFFAREGYFPDKLVMPFAEHIDPDSDVDVRTGAGVRTDRTGLSSLYNYSDNRNFLSDIGEFGLLRSSSRTSFSDHHSALMTYWDGSNQFVIPAVYKSDLEGYVSDSDDTYVIAYDAALNRFSYKANSFQVLGDTTPQLGGQLDVNGQAIGDGTRELLTFTEDASAVNHVNIENEVTGSGPIISAAGDDTNIDLNLSAKGTGNISLGNITFDADQSIGAGQDNYVLTYDHSAGTIGLEAASGGGIALTDLSVGAEASASGDGAISYDNSTGVFTYTPPTAAGISAAAASHNHATSDITSGTFADARIAQSNVTQHQAALSITESQISDLGTYLTGITGESVGSLSDVTITSVASGEVLKWSGSAWINNTLAEAGIAAASHTHATSDITSGTFADARIAQSNVTQHQAALSITESQISDLGSYITASSTNTLTNKTFDANGTGNSLSNVETADLASTAKTGADTKVVTGTEGTNGNLVSWNADGDAVDSSIVASNVALTDGDTYTGTHDFGGATLEIPNAAAPSLSTAGQIALDTTTTDHTALLKYHDGTNEFVIPAILSSGLSTTDNDVIAYNAANNRFEMEAQSGSGGGMSDVVDDTTPQLGGDLDVNGNSIGDGTRELLTFTEDGSAVNHINIENQATGSGPIISAAGDDTNVDLNISAKGTGTILGGKTQLTNSSAAQLLVRGWGPDSTGNDGGAIQLGEESAFHGLISYDNATSVLYIDNAYNSNNGDIGFRTKTAGTAVTPLRLKGSGQTIINGTSALATATIYGHDAADEALVIKAASGQSADLVEIQNNSGTKIFSINSIGSILNLSNSNGVISHTGNQFFVRRGTSNAKGFCMDVFGPNGFRVSEGEHIGFADFTGGFDTAANTTIRRIADAHLAINGASATDTCQVTVGSNTSLGTLTIYGHSASDETLVVRAASSQSADILQIQNSGGTELVTVDSSGKLGINSASPNATLTVNGSMSLPIESISATDTLDDSNHTVLVNASGGSRTVNLPAASGSTGKVFIIKKTDSSSNNVVIDPNASETIDGSSTFTFNAQYRAVTIQCDGSNWHIISSYIVNY